MPKLQLTSKIIIPKRGEKFAFHVFTPALQYRFENRECNLPVMALRSSLKDYQAMQLFHKIECLGPSSLEPLFNKPLPGTGGRGVAIMFTKSPMKVWYPKGKTPRIIKTLDGLEPKKILQDVITKYEAALT
jgi:hypothetical protein